MSLRILFSFLVASILFSGSCKKNDESLTTTGSQRSDCYNFPLPPGSGYNSVSARKLWSGATFNPNDNNQILYEDETSAMSFASLITKLSNTSDTFEVTHSPLAGNQWSKTGWILLGDFGGNIYKIKQNGDSLTAFNTYTSMNFYATWSPDGKKIIFSGEYGSLGGLFTMNADGSSQKSLISNGDKPSWSPSGTKIAYCTAWHLAYLDTISRLNFVIDSFDVNDEMSVSGISWFPDSKNLVFVVNSGLYKINCDTKQVTLLRTNCDSRRYEAPSVSSDGTKILITRVDSKLTNSYTQYSEVNIYIMNADGSNEVKVNLK